MKQFPAAFTAKTFFAVLLCAAAPLLFSSRAEAWAPKKAPLMTKWAAQVDPARPLPEYPRPQLVRADWLNLNGVWQYQSGAGGDATPFGKKLSGEILVPFPVESALSGVMEHHDRLWYRRTFTVPANWKNRQLLLHFGAVDYEAEVFLNGHSLGVHRGGYEPFSYNVTPYLNSGGTQELIVRVFDPTELGAQPRGKQTTQPGGIMYTPTTGIWQTVWLEPVARTFIQGLHVVPDLDGKRVVFNVVAARFTPRTRAFVTIRDGGKVVQTAAFAPNRDVAIPLRNAKLWSPDNPFLYDVEVRLMEGKTLLDRAGSYFGMRKISLGKAGGVPRMLLNDKFVFQMGPLDQGFWPDGIYTAPTDDALKSDIQTMKRLGFNMVRKHIKIEPARWYYHADKLGLLVWQDMPSPNSYIEKHPPVDKAAFEKQLRNVITTHWNHPSIVMWIIFNEGQGYHDTRRLTALAKTLDPTRLVNRNSSSGYDQGADGNDGDIDDVHSYPQPAFPPPSPSQALTIGEYGGIGHPVPGHLWKGEGWGYASAAGAKELEETYGEFSTMLKNFRDEHGLSGAVYTQLTDVEIEVNGLMTYDRVLKIDPSQIALANRFQYPVPTYREIVPTSEKAAQTWNYVFTAPAANWHDKTFDDSAWQRGAGGFGADASTTLRIGTPWTTSDIWLRRTFTLGELSDVQRSQLVLRDYHDEDVEVFINGVAAYSAGGFATYEYKPLSEAARQSLVANGENVIAIHCHQTSGGQYIDAGLSQRIPAAQ